MNARNFEVNFLRILVFLVPVVMSIEAVIERKQGEILATKISSIKTEEQAENILVELMDLLKKKENEEAMLKLQCFISLNKHIFQDQSSHLLSTKLIYAYTGKQKNSRACLTDLEVGEEDWHNFIFLVIEKILESNQNYSRLRIIQGSYQFYTMGKLWESINSLNKITEMNPSIYDRFGATRITLNIENLVQSRQRDVIKNIGVDVLEVVSYEEKFHEFLRLIQMSVEQLIDFWNELKQESPSGKKIHSLGLQLTKNYKDIDERFNEIAEMNVDNLKIFKIYSDFLKEVAHDEKKLIQIFENLEYGNEFNLREKIDLSKNKVEAKDLLLITLSGNISSLGVVLNASNSLFRFLGWKPSEVIGENVTMLQPDFFAKQHAGFLKRFFRSEEPRILNKNIVVFGQTREGYLRNIKIRVMFMPSLETGIRLVGIMTTFQNEDLPPVMKKSVPKEAKVHYIMFNINNGSILGVSSSCYEEYGINSNLFVAGVSKPPGINIFIEDILDKDKREKFETEGLNTFIDTRKLHEDNYLAALAQEDKYNFDDQNKEEDSFEGLENQEYKDPRLRRVPIKAWLVDFMSYLGQDLCCVRFYEETEQGGSEGPELEYLKESIEKIKDSLKSTTKTTENTGNYVIFTYLTDRMDIRKIKV